MATLEGRLPGIMAVCAFREACRGSHDGPLAKNCIPNILGFTCIQVEATLESVFKARESEIAHGRRGAAASARKRACWSTGNAYACKLYQTLEQRSLCLLYTSDAADE